MKSNLYSLIWVTEGMIDLSVDELLVSLNSHQMTFITPVQYVRLVENHGKVQLIQFNREFYCIRENDHEVSCDGILYFGTQGVPVIDLSSKEIDSFERLLGVLEEEFEIIDAIQEEMLRTILKKWLIKSTRILKRQKQFLGEHEPKVELLRQFKILLEKNYKQYHKVKEYASLLNKSPKTIANQFKILGQKSPSAMIQDRIIAEAKRYILYSSLSVKEIAYNLGFEDAPSFSNYFKSKTGISPKYFAESAGQ
ncbi:MAG: AraC family transcriptional regulator [Bacteroidota bacterium]